MSTTVVPPTPSSSNATLLRGDRPVLVDAGTPEDVDALRTKLTEHGTAVVGDMIRGGFVGGRTTPGHPLQHHVTEDRPTVRRVPDAPLTGGAGRLPVGHGGPLRAAAVRRRFDRVVPA